MQTKQTNKHIWTLMSSLCGVVLQKSVKNPFLSMILHHPADQTTSDTANTSAC